MESTGKAIDAPSTATDGCLFVSMSLYVSLLSLEDKYVSWEWWLGAPLGLLSFVKDMQDKLPNATRAEIINAYLLRNKNSKISSQFDSDSDAEAEEDTHGSQFDEHRHKAAMNEINRSHSKEFIKLSNLSLIWGPEFMFLDCIWH